MYKWYDKLKEPKRFLVFFIPAAILIVGANVHCYGIDIVSVLLLGVLMISRIWYIYKN